MQHRSKLAAASAPLQSAAATDHASPPGQQSGSDESARYNSEISSLNAEVKKLKADKQDLLARLSHAEEEEEEEKEGGNTVAQLDTEVARLKTDRQLLVGRLEAAEQLLAEARSAVDQEEGHLQGLQVCALTCLLSLFFWMVFRTPPSFPFVA